MPPLSSSLALPPHGPAVDRDALQGGQGLPHPREGDAAASQSCGDRLDGDALVAGDEEATDDVHHGLVDLLVAVAARVPPS